MRIRRRLVPADENNRFIRSLSFGVFLARHLVKTHILMAQNPLRNNIVRRLLSFNGALKNPIPDQMIK